MKTTAEEAKCLDDSTTAHEETTDFLIDKTPEMGHNKVVKTVNSDTRSVSLSSGLVEEVKCPPLVKGGVDQWFRTWPADRVTANTQNDSDNLVNKSSNKVSLSEALQNISLAYSPVTKQLHLIETKLENGNIDDSNKKIKYQDEKTDTDINEPKKGHRRIEAGSFSSTISSLSDPSPSGSLLDSDERSITSFDIDNNSTSRKGLGNFFTRNVFSWKSGNATNTNSSVWKLFSKSSRESLSNSPHHIVSSTALIQHARPSNLPAKTEEEEQRHREEYKAILAAAKKKEAQNTVARQKMQKLQLLQEEHHATVTKHFLQYVLPNWEAMRTNKKTRDLWWQGLPSSVRGKVWRLAIGNELNVTEQLYEICLLRAKNRLNSPNKLIINNGNNNKILNGNEDTIDQESSMDLIKLDISRTFPHLLIFQEGGPYSNILHSLLAAYVCYRPDVGYVQGMSYIAAILILNMEQMDAFVCFANLLNQPLHLSAFTLNQKQIETYYLVYNELFSYNLPKLYKHFQLSGLTPDLYLLDWIYTIFAKAMPLDIACRVWDIFLRDGYEFIFRTALGILHLNQDTLIDMDFLHGAQFLTRLPDDLSSDQLFKSIQIIQTNTGKLNFYQIVEKCSVSLNESDS